MPRRPPSRIRLDQAVKALGAHPVGRVAGLSPQGQRAVDRLEVSRGEVGSTAVAVDGCRQWVRDPALRARVTESGCGVPECCPDPALLREWLHVVVRHLPRRDREVLQRLLDEVGTRW